MTGRARRKSTTRPIENPFHRFVNGLIEERYQTSQALADDLDMSLSALRRGVKTGGLGPETLLKLAEVAGVEPGMVLVAANRIDLADRLDRLYGPARDPLSSDDRALLALAPDVKHQLLRLIAGLTPKQKKGRPWKEAPKTRSNGSSRH